MNIQNLVWKCISHDSSNRFNFDSGILNQMAILPKENLLQRSWPSCNESLNQLVWTSQTVTTSFPSNNLEQDRISIISKSDNKSLIKNLLFAVTICTSKIVGIHRNYWYFHQLWIQKLFHYQTVYTRFLTHRDHQNMFDIHSC